ncbi:hypothetical protein [Pseudomonas indica]|uniref:hypothetical protein n=1 Tax=Pseudomonas indica TaxID=137658 RepID=UPI000BAB5833|nr:hypothetical protein [Pseudomonas indica]PAU51890.1 hypothetical protein BZL42_25460 [Pseudomonas indica]
MKLNRERQLEILNELAIHYPAPVPGNMLGVTNEDVANIAYLNEHGLVEAAFRRNGMGMVLNGFVKITATGMDFLEDDGGLTAIRGVVTIKFHEDALKAIIESKIAGSDLPEEQKSSLIRTVRDLPGETIKHLTTRLVDLGLDNMPKAIQAIHTFLSQNMPIP